MEDTCDGVSRTQLCLEAIDQNIKLDCIFCLGYNLSVYRSPYTMYCISYIMYAVYLCGYTVKCVIMLYIAWLYCISVWLCCKLCSFYAVCCVLLCCISVWLCCILCSFYAVCCVVLCCICAVICMLYMLVMLCIV